VEFTTKARRHKVSSAQWGEAAGEPLAMAELESTETARAFAATKPLRRRRREDARPTELFYCPANPVF
jgi:hypothetical protein